MCLLSEYYYVGIHSPYFVAVVVDLFCNASEGHPNEFPKA